MRYRFTLPRRPAVTLAVCATLAGLLSTPALAAPARHGTTPTTVSRSATQPPSPTGSTLGTADHSVLQRRPLTPAQLPPTQPTFPRPRPSTEHDGKTPPNGRAKAASCDPADFADKTDSALVAVVEASSTACINTLFAVTGTNARDIF